MDYEMACIPEISDGIAVLLMASRDKDVWTIRYFKKDSIISRQLSDPGGCVKNSSLFPVHLLQWEMRIRKPVFDFLKRRGPFNPHAAYQLEQITMSRLHPPL